MYRSFLLAVNPLGILGRPGLGRQQVIVTGGTLIVVLAVTKTSGQPLAD